MNSSVIIQHRERMARFLEDEKRAGVFDVVPVAKGGRGLVGEGRGIIFIAGNDDTLSRVMVTLRLLRQWFACRLPAAIFQYRSERPDPNSPVLGELQQLNAKLVEVTGRDRDPTWQKKLPVESPKHYRVRMGRSCLHRNPELLFDAPNYKRLGVFFTPDYWKTSANNPIWHIIGVQCRDEWEQEAGLIVIDKRRHLDALLLSHYMLTDWQFWFHFSDGDKDVFRFSMLALRKRWALPGRYVGGGGLPKPTESGDFCAHTMQQHDHAGRPMFIHYNLLKQATSNIFLGYTWGRTKQVAAFPSQRSQTWNSGTPSSGLSRDDLARSPYPDPVVRGADDVEADMLANANDDGWTIYSGTDEARRRAALERGIRPFFHGGGNKIYCMDMRREDPAAKSQPRPKYLVKYESEVKLVSGPNRLGIDWDTSPLEIVQWEDDERLKDFERKVYELGFQPTMISRS